MQKKLVMLVIFCLGTITAQELKWDKFSLGAVAQYNSPAGDFGDNWESSISGGVLVNYELSPSVSYEVWLTYSRFSPKENISTIPEMDLISFPFGLKYKILLLENNFLSLFGGLEQNMFDFEESDEREENLNESEMGCFLCIGYEFQLTDEIDTQFFIKYQQIFSKPENMTLINFGFQMVLK